MRVLHIGKYFPPAKGGMEQFLADLLPALKKLGFEVAALVHAHGERVEQRKPFRLVRARRLGEWLYTPISPSFPLELHRLLKAFRPHLIHLHLPNPAAFWTLLLPEARSIPVVVHWHADVVPSTLDRRLVLAYRLYRPFEQKLLKRAKAVIATSPPYAEGSEPLARHRSKVRTIPLGLDPERLKASPEAKRWAERLWLPGTFRLLHIGRLTYYKGHEAMFEAVKALAGVQLLCVGDGPRKRRLRQEVRALGLEGRVAFLGEVDDDRRNALLSSCDLLLLPSLERTEAFGLVLLEAMACGKPVVASDIAGSGVGWVVREGRCGLLVPPSDPEALREAISRLWNRPEERAFFGQAGRNRFGERFHIDRVARLVRQVYREMA